MDACTHLSTALSPLAAVSPDPVFLPIVLLQLVKNVLSTRHKRIDQLLLGEALQFNGINHVTRLCISRHNPCIDGLESCDDQGTFQTCDGSRCAVDGRGPRRPEEMGSCLEAGHVHLNILARGHVAAASWCECPMIG